MAGANPQQTPANLTLVQGRTPPANVEAEKAVLGGIFLDRDSIPIIREALDAEDFLLDGHRKIYQAMLHLYEEQQNAPIDLITVSDELGRRGWLNMIGGEAYLLELNRVVPSAANIDYYCGIVRQKATLRRLITTCNEVIGESYEFGGDLDELLDRAETGILKVGERRVRGKVRSIGDVQNDCIQKLEELWNTKGDITGIDTGFGRLNAVTSGWQGGDLVILAGRPAMGKTSLALNFVTAAARSGKRVLFCSLEMPNDQIFYRILSMEASIDLFRIRSGKFNQGDWPKMTRHYDRIRSLPLFLDESAGLTISEIRTKARRMYQDRNAGLDMVVIDYLQLMSAPGSSSQESREQVISQISRGLKLLAKELNIPVLALSQLNRTPEGRTDKRPMMSDLRESGAIEQDADMILMLYRDEVYNKETPSAGKAEVNIVKHRNGPTDTVELAFDKRYSRFGDLDEYHDPDLVPH